MAILTNNLPLCDYYRSESQNVKAKNYCSDSAHNNEASCTLAGAEWEEMAPFGIDPPECVERTPRPSSLTWHPSWHAGFVARTPCVVEVSVSSLASRLNPKSALICSCYAISFTRDNHLGNTINGYEVGPALV